MQVHVCVGLLSRLTCRRHRDHKHTRGTHACGMQQQQPILCVCALPVLSATATDLCMVSIWLRRRPCKFVLARHLKLLHQSSLSSLWKQGPRPRGRTSMDTMDVNGRRSDAIEPAKS